MEDVGLIVILVACMAGAFPRPFKKKEKNKGGTRCSMSPIKKTSIREFDVCRRYYATHSHDKYFLVLEIERLQDRWAGC